MTPMCPYSSAGRATDLLSVGPRFESVWGHHLNQRLSENHAGPFVFGETQGKHFTAHFVITAGGVDCRLVARSIE